MATEQTAKNPKNKRQTRGKYNMNSISKFLNTNPKKYSPKTKTIIFCLIMFPTISFCGWFAVQSIITSSENLEYLTHVTGNITNNRIMKHRHESKYRTYYEDVLVISIQGCDDELGFMNYNENYSKLTNLVNTKSELIADVYYDKSRQRIEQNVTLHTFDLKINNERLVKIEDIRKSELTGSLIFSLITILLTWLTYVGVKRVLLKGVIG